MKRNKKNNTHRIQMTKNNKTSDKRQHKQNSSKKSLQTPPKAP